MTVRNAQSIQGATTRSAKHMRTSAAVQAYQKEYFMNIKDRVSQGEPFIFSGVMVPHEIFEAMDIPFVVSAWWMAINAAKRLSGYWRERADKERSEQGYGRFGLCSRCGMGWATIAEEDPEHLAYGGLPKITAVVDSEGRCPGAAKASEIELRQYRQRGWNVPVFTLEETAPPPYYPRYENWWENVIDHWDEVIEPHRLDYRVEELKALIKFLEVTTKRKFNQNKLIEVLEMANEQNLWWRKARDLIAKTSPAPVDVVDQTSNYPAQWHRGTPQGLALAKMFYEETKERVERGEAVYPNEKIRVQWLKAGNWADTAFYQYFADKYGAVFVNSLYLSIASDGYPRKFLNDPLRSLASRHIMLGLYAGNGWYLHDAKLHNCKAAVMYDTNCQTVTHTGPLMTKLSYEAAGIPLCVISPSWDAEKMRSTFSDFIETRILAKQT